MKPCTSQRDLHGGRSLWQARPVKLPSTAALRANRECDVIVVGAGISGVIVAEALSDAGWHVILCDRRGPLQGATSASTAMVMHEVDTPLCQLAQRLGQHDAQRIWRRSFLAVQALRDRARNLGIDAGIEVQDSLYLQGNVLNAHGLHRELQARRRAGFEVSYLTAPQVQAEYGIHKRAALRSAGSFIANPRALAAGFLRAAVSRGTEVFAPEEIIEVQSLRGGVHARTASGYALRSRRLIFATGYEPPAQVPQRGYRISSTWAIATVQQPHAARRIPALIWEASSPYLYVRTTADGRVLCGGGDEAITDAARRDALLSSKQLWLQHRLHALLPRVIARAAFAWSGTFGSTDSGLPLIGAVPRMKNCFAMLGYGGNGITFSMMGAQILRNVLDDQHDADLDLVALDRRTARRRKLR